MNSTHRAQDDVALPEEKAYQPHDSEDSLSQEHVASELRRLHELRAGTPPTEVGRWRS